MKRAYTHIHMDCLSDALGVPNEVRILSVVVSPERNGITLVLEGEGLPRDCEQLHGDGGTANCFNTIRELKMVVSTQRVVTFREWG